MLFFGTLYKTAKEEKQYHIALYKQILEWYYILILIIYIYIYITACIVYALFTILIY